MKEVVKKNVDEIDEAYLKGIKFTFVESMQEVLNYALSLKK